MSVVTHWKMHGIRCGALLAFAGWMWLAPQLLRAQSGSIEGRVINVDTAKTPMPAVRVVIDELGNEAYTDEEGRYTFRDIPPGNYSLTLSEGKNTVKKPGISVTADTATHVETSVDWLPATVFSVTVTAVSRRPERIVDAPAAAEVLDSKDIERESASGQLPRLLADMPGVELVQSGILDFNPNTRGFNASINRHILTSIDGRDPSDPEVLGYTQWASIPFSLGELKTAEFVRGPGAALYGAGAYNGVLNLTTKSAWESLGGEARITLGELRTGRSDFREAVNLGRGWAFLVDGGYQQSADFTQSRLDNVEYRPDLLQKEPVAPPLDTDKISYARVRMDKKFGESDMASFEFGNANFSGMTFETGLGRNQVGSVNRPWGRVNVSLPGWNFLGFYTGNDSNHQVSLASGAVSYLDTYNSGVEAQRNDYFNRGKGRLVIGGSYGHERVDSLNPQGVETVFNRPYTAEREALFGQADYDFTPKLKGVGSLRWDAGTLYNSRISPRVALVYSPSPNQAIRVTLNDAFRSPSLAEFFLNEPVAPPLNLSALEQALAPLLGGTTLGFSQIPLLVVGNQDLKVEKIQSFEVGYNAVIRNSLSASVSIYRSRLTDFTTNLLPQAGTSLGRLNPMYGPYMPPASLSPQATAAVLGALQGALLPSLFAALSNNPNGSPVFILYSFASFGRANTDGVELALKYALNSQWRFQTNYSFFDFSIGAQAPESPLVPNAPAHQAKAGIFYTGKRLDASARYRWVNSFIWTDGIYSGPVPSYSLVDANVNYHINRRWGLGIDAANVLNDRHYEMFGGDILRRRVLAYLDYSW